MVRNVGVRWDALLPGVWASVRRYLRHVAVALARFSDELLCTALHVVLCVRPNDAVAGSEPRQGRDAWSAECVGRQLRAYAVVEFALREARTLPVLLPYAALAPLAPTRSGASEADSIASPATSSTTAYAKRCA